MGKAIGTGLAGVILLISIAGASIGTSYTEDRNAVLFFVVPARHKFVVLGDCGIHEKVGQEFWYRIASILAERLRQGDFTGGIEAGIEAVGEGLATHFPHPDSETNDLPY